MSHASPQPEQPELPELPNVAPLAVSESAPDWAAVQGRIRVWRLKQALYRGVMFCALTAIFLVLCGLIRDRWEAQAAPNFLAQLERAQPLPERLPPFDPAQVVLPETPDITLHTDPNEPAVP